VRAFNPKLGEVIPGTITIKAGTVTIGTVIQVATMDFCYGIALPKSARDMRHATWGRDP
jgi:hypothetical protein